MLARAHCGNESVPLVRRGLNGNSYGSWKKIIDGHRTGRGFHPWGHFAKGGIDHPEAEISGNSGPVPSARNPLDTTGCSLVQADLALPRMGVTLRSPRSASSSRAVHCLSASRRSSK